MPETLVEFGCLATGFVLGGCAVLLLEVLFGEAR